MKKSYKQLEAPISRIALTASATLLETYLDERVREGKVSPEMAERIKETTVYELREALEEGQRNIWLENMKADHEAHEG